MDGERMHAAGQFARQRRIDHAMAFEPALSTERFRYDIEAEMSLAAGPVSGVALVPMRFILDMEALRRESCAQLFRDEIAGLHVGLVARIERGRNLECGAPLQMRRAQLPDCAPRLPGAALRHVTPRYVSPRYVNSRYVNSAHVLVSALSSLEGAIDGPA